jgi:ribosomal small subunit protein bTHX
MGKGDIKTEKGKRHNHSYGVKRPRKNKKDVVEKSIVASVPKDVLDAIKEHIKSKIKDTENIHRNLRKEDGITGHLFGNLKIDWQSFSNGWRWNIEYDTPPTSKRETDSEKTIGADGVISLNVMDRGILKFKTVIFQSKIDGNIDNRHLSKQIEKMEKSVPKGNIVVIYTSDGYYAQKGNEYTKENRRDMTLGYYLTERFLTCKHGDRKHKYNPETERMELIMNIENESN